MTEPEERRHEFKPTIFRAGLLLVLVPFLLGSTCLVALNQVWLSTGRLNERMQMQITTMFKLTSEFRDVLFYSYGQMASAFQNTRSASLMPPFNDREFLTHIKEITSSDSPERSAELIAAGKRFSGIAVEIAQVAASLNGDQYTNNAARFGAYSRVITSGLSLSDEILLFGERERTSQQTMSDEQHRLNDQIRLIIFLGFGSTTLATILILAAFVPRVLVRMEKLSHNARAIAGQQLSEVGGDDELSYLNSVFQSTAQQLREAREQYNNIMQVIADDIRTPVLDTKEFAAKFRSHLNDESNAIGTRCCNSIQASSQQVLDFVDELLAQETLASPNTKCDFTEFSLFDASAECIESLSALAAKQGITFINECTNDLLRADRSRVVHVLMNFLSNAAKFSAPDANVRIFDTRAENGVTVTVEDHGQGMTDEVSSRVFEKYFQGPQSAEKRGTGLGLWLCKAHIEQQGGKVGVSSQPGKGSKFWFTLPTERASDTKSSAPINNLPHATSSIKERVKITKHGIIQRGLAIAILPVLAQAGWLLWMNQQISQAEQLQEMERKEFNFAVDISRLWLFTFKADSYSAFFLATQAPNYKELAEQNFDQASKTITTLDNDVAALNSKSMSNAWFDTRNFVKFEAMRRRQLLNRTRAKGKHLGLLAQSLQRSQSVIEYVAALQTEQLKALAQTKLAQQEFFDNVQRVIGCAVAVNLLMNVALWLLYRRQVLGRLEMLVNFAKQIAKNRRLEDVPVGSDEFGLLAEHLKKSSSDLEEARERRQMLLRMVAHDIRSPLASINVAIDTLEVLVSQSKSKDEQLKSDLAATKSNVTRVLSLVNDLLSADRMQTDC